MKKNNLLVVVILLVLLFYVDPVYAGPGGVIAKAFFKTWWGKVIGVVLFIILSPLILYTYIVESMNVKKTKKQLLRASKRNKDFSWLNLDQNFKNVVTRVYDAWSKEDMSLVQEYVNNWYWQNQQLIHLNRWKDQNLKNICSLQSLNSIKPLYIELSDEDDFDGSKIVISISGYIEDYLIEIDTKKVVEGKRGFQEETHIWVMEYVNGEWLLCDIKDESYSLSFAKLANVVPESILNTQK